jgi:TetR/AcrR family tetracycline transcriptional repressor
MAGHDETDQGLSRARVTSAGLDLLQAKGIEGLTMRALADSLGVRAASIYWHIRDRRELVELLAESLLREVAPTEGDEPWRAAVTTLATDLRRMLAAHRDASRLLLETPSTVERSSIFEALRRLLEGAGLNSAQASETARMVAFHVVLDGLRDVPQVTDPEAGRPATLVLETGTRGVTIKAATTGNALVTVPREGTAPAAVSIAGDVVTVRRPRGIGRAEVELDPTRAWSVHVKGSTFSTELALTGLDIHEVYVDGGASRVDCVLPSPRGVVSVHISGGVVGAKLHRPATAAVHAEVSPGAIRVRLDRRSILMAATETHWESGGGAASADRFEILISGGAVQVSLDDNAPATVRSEPGPASKAPDAPEPSASVALDVLLDGVESARSRSGADR